MTLLESLYGMLEVKLVSADPEAALRAIEKAGISLQNIRFEDALQISFTLPRKDWKALQALATQRSDTLSLSKKRGLYWSISAMVKRPVLLCGFALLMFLSIWVPSRIFFIQVEGNEQVYTNEIIEQAALCGIRFGASRKEVRSERMKNALLERMPEINWAGVNTYGCVAVITVEESQTPAQKNAPCTVSSIVAAADGVIRSVTVLKGSSVCQVGQAVKVGDVLISGFTDQGSFLRATNAMGEVYADTIRQITAYSPMTCQLRQMSDKITVKYGIIIGKKRINFNNSSGISDAGCVRIYSEKCITLPGGFQLPLAIYQEKWISCELQPSEYIQDKDRIDTYMQKYLLMNMIGGQIGTSALTVTQMWDVCRYDGIYGCYEMIGISRAEEYLLDYEDH